MSQTRLLSSEKFVDLGGFEYKGLFGKGNYAEVRKIIHESTGTAFAVKRTPSLFNNPQDCKRSLREILLLIILDHPNIVKLRHLFKPDDLEKFNEIEFALDFKQRSLQELLYSETPIDERQVKSYLYQCFLALKHLNTVNIAHRDLTPGNILLNKNDDLVLCDLNLSRMIETDTLKKLLEKLKEQLKAKSTDSKETPIRDSDKESKAGHPSKSRPRRLTSEVVTIWWRAPEILLACLGSTTSYGTRSDIWSIGIIGYQLLKKQQGDTAVPHPFTKMQNLAQLIEIFNFFGINPSDEDLKDIKNTNIYNDLKGDGKRKRTKFVDKFPKADSQLTNLLDKMLEVDPEKRISPEEALNHPFFKDLVKAEDLKPSTPLQLTNEQGQLTPAGRAAEILCELEEDSLSIAKLRRLYRNAISIFNPEVAAVPSPLEYKFQEGSLKELPCYRDVPLEETEEELKGQPPGTCVLCPSSFPGLLNCAYVERDGSVSEDLLLISNIVGELDFLQEMLDEFGVARSQILAKSKEKMTLTEHLHSIQTEFEGSSSSLEDSDDESEKIIAEKGPLILRFDSLPAADAHGEKEHQSPEAAVGSRGFFGTSQQSVMTSTATTAESSFRCSYPWFP